MELILFRAPVVAPGMAPSVSAAVLTVLFWWCEETDHTADGVCNILWSSQQLGMTSDGTQANGLRLHSQFPASQIPCGLRVRAAARPGADDGGARTAHRGGVCARHWLHLQLVLHSCRRLALLLAGAGVQMGMALASPAAPF